MGKNNSSTAVQSPKDVRVNKMMSLMFRLIQGKLAKADVIAELTEILAKTGDAKVIREAMKEMEDAAARMSLACRSAVQEYLPIATGQALGKVRKD